MPTPIDVLIVGAGPTGLMLGCELALRKVPFRIIDKTPERAGTSRALAVQARTLEVLARHGLAEQMLANGRTSLAARAFVGRKQVTSVKLSDIGVEDTAYPVVLIASQVVTERALEGRLRALGHEVERPVELTRLEVNGKARCVLQTPRGEEVVTPRFVVGCDGAHSAVRKQGGFSFEGDAYENGFILGDVKVDGDLPPGEILFFIAKDGPLVALPLVGESRYRIISVRAMAENEGPPQLEELQRRIDERSPIPVKLSDAAWLTHFRLHHRIADRFRRGPLFLCGDAAHIHSPAGGQGMNTGIQDAFNLGWKLALACRGIGGETLLESYAEERRPVGLQLLNTTDRIFSGATTPGLMGVLRTRLVPKLAPWVLASKSRRALLFRFISELRISYRDSSIVSTGTSFGLQGGDRVPDGPLTLPDGTPSTLHVQLQGPAPKLLVWSDAPPPGLAAAAGAIRDALGGELGVIEFSNAPRAGACVPSAVLQSRLGVRGLRMDLVRPDGHLSARTDSLDPTPLLLHLRRILRS
ncbi:MAG: FAD-dependent monooxygenase [Deltaproteobacteria bacterium]|nr:FAD-dependent monooxygenase [Deltaproteobacteria bacterium]